jgi:hypothetical protein
MAARWSIAGRWQGRYSYDGGEGTQPRTAVSFSMELRQSWFGRFSGSVQDDPGRGPPEGGRVQGRIIGDRVEFLKWMPVFYVQDGDRLQTLREYLECQCRLPLDRDVRPPPVCYRGQYSADTGQLSGRWEIQAGIIRFSSAGRPYEYPIPIVTGAWEISREASL